MDYIQKIRELVEEKKITKRELSSKIQKNENTIANYFNKKTKLDVDTLIKIADILDVPVGWFFEKKNEQSKNKLNEELLFLFRTVSMFEDGFYSGLFELVKDKKTLDEKLHAILYDLQGRSAWNLQRYTVLTEKKLELLRINGFLTKETIAIITKIKEEKDSEMRNLEELANENYKLK